MADPNLETLTQELLNTTPDPITDPEPTTQLTETSPHISLHALMGHPIPQTIRLLGHIDSQPLSILIDSGSTHNFIQDRVAKQLGLNLEPTQSFQVLVGNGEELNCSHMSQQTPLLLTLTFFLLTCLSYP
jgi:hypothetical protein